MKRDVVILNSAYVILVRVIWSTWTVIGRHDMKYLGLTFVSLNRQKRWYGRGGKSKLKKAKKGIL